MRLSPQCWGFFSDFKDLVFLLLSTTFALWMFLATIQILKIKFLKPEIQQQSTFFSLLTGSHAVLTADTFSNIQIITPQSTFSIRSSTQAFHVDDVSVQSQNTMFVSNFNVSVCVRKFPSEWKALLHASFLWRAMQWSWGAMKLHVSCWRALTGKCPHNESTKPYGVVFRAITDRISIDWWLSFS